MSNANVTDQSLACAHRGFALWANDWQWYCPICGFLGSVPAIRGMGKFVKGDLVDFGP